ncbi:hypothetical protein HPB48_009877 [Haemaphysalis longicornis]|uniref:DDE Tnp4 domain-containing protein n=1 Tax=Haemaphysalis longicornis TaxID=44386 RepID=A0A9J6GKP8_HAELO|nr:hypothetical protein HPB48_009877 [Haemaphysalis longicornis]
MTGKGRSCINVGAILWKVKVAVPLGLTAASCTDTATQWNRGMRRNLEPSPLEDISFRLQNGTVDNPPSKRRREAFTVMTAEEIKKIHEGSPFSGLFKIPVGERLTKEWLCREPLSSEEHLALTLRYLSSGMRIPDVAMAFRVRERNREAGHPPELPDAATPSETEWRDVASGYWQRWEFPNCLGAVDGKHVQIECPRKSGSLYYNYKGTFSIVLMAVVDSRYLFTLADIGEAGHLSDGGIVKDSLTGQRLNKGKLNLPRAQKLPRTSTLVPHVFVGEEAFQLRPDFMRPLPGTRTRPEGVIYNYQLSRAMCGCTV